MCSFHDCCKYTPLYFFIELCHTVNDPSIVCLVVLALHWLTQVLYPFPSNHSSSPTLNTPPPPPPIASENTICVYGKSLATSQSIWAEYLRSCGPGLALVQPEPQPATPRQYSTHITHPQPLPSPKYWILTWASCRSLATWSEYGLRVLCLVALALHWSSQSLNWWAFSRSEL